MSYIQSDIIYEKAGKNSPLAVEKKNEVRREGNEGLLNLCKILVMQDELILENYCTASANSQQCCS